MDGLEHGKKKRSNLTAIFLRKELADKLSNVLRKHNIPLSHLVYALVYNVSIDNLVFSLRVLQPKLTIDEVEQVIKEVREVINEYMGMSAWPTEQKEEGHEV